MESKIRGAIDKLKNLTDDADEKEIWDSALDLVEAIVEKTPTKIDDIILKPIIRIIRRRFDID